MAHRRDFEEVLDTWPEITAALKKQSTGLETLVEILRGIEAPLTWSEMTPPVDEAQVKFAFLNASLMRKRLTIGDLLIFTNWDRERLWQEVWGRCQSLRG